MRADEARPRRGERRKMQAHGCFAEASAGARLCRRLGAGVDRGLDRHAGPNQRAESGMAVQRDFHRNALHHFGEIARRVVGRQQRESASGAGRPTVDMTREDQVRKSVDGDARGLAEAHIRHLRFLVICEHPDVGQRHGRDDLRADIDELARPDLTLADETVCRRNDVRVSEIVARQRDLRLGGANLRLELFLLIIETRQNGLLLRELRFVQLELRMGAFVVGVRLLQKLLRSRRRMIDEIALASVFEIVAQHVGLGGIDGRLGLADERVLYVPLVREIGERRLRRRQIGVRQGELSFVIGGIDDRDQIALVDGLIVVDSDAGDIAGHPCRKRGDVAGDIGVVGGLQTRGAGPSVPIPSDVPDQPGRGEQKYHPQRGENPTPSSLVRRFLRR